MHRTSRHVSRAFSPGRRRPSRPRPSRPKPRRHPPRPRLLPPEPFEPFAATTTVEAARLKLSTALRGVGIGSADLDARLLVCAALGLDHAAMIRDPHAPLGSGATVLTGFAQKRMMHEPVARILGRREFWGLSFELDRSVLDPRPDTEGVVGSLLDAIGGRRQAALKILDLGTGSGAILCALLTEMQNAWGVGVDRDPAACLMASRNVAALGLGARAHIVCGCWSDGLGTRFDVVVSNPPYIRRADVAGLPPDVRDYDPIGALDGGPDGLDAYRAIVPKLDALLVFGGVAAFECGWDQGETIASLLGGVGLHGVMTYKDLAGHDRVVLGTASRPGVMAS